MRVNLKTSYSSFFCPRIYKKKVCFDRWPIKSFYFHYALSSTITWIIPPTNALGVFHQKIFLALLLCLFFILIIEHYFSEEETGGASTEAAAVAQPVADSPPSRNRSVYWDPRNGSVYWDPRNRSVRILCFCSVGTTSTRNKSAGKPLV